MDIVNLPSIQQVILPPPLCKNVNGGGYSLFKIFCQSAKCPHVILICIYLKSEIGHIFYISKKSLFDFLFEKQSVIKMDCSEVKMILHLLVL